jgi:hypothetical protein
MISMEHWWNDNDRGKQEYAKKNLYHCHFVRHIYHKDSPGIEPDPLRILTA